MSDILRIGTYNIHKGLSSFSVRMVLQDQRELIRSLGVDIMFLQEVRGKHDRHSRLFTGGQYEFLVRSNTDHGNCILSKYPIVNWENEDISAHPTEERGLLHCEINVPGWEENLHCICVHLGLLGSWRHQQLVALENRIKSMVPANAPLIIAGDFNDWRQKAGSTLATDLNLQEVFERTMGKPARSFPSVMPFFRLDRIYTRGFQIQKTQVHSGPRFANTSDHAALTAALCKQ